MLLEMLFCTGFFILPLIGMFAMVIAQVIRNSKEEKLEQERHMLPLRKRIRTRSKAVPVFAYLKTMDYQLLEAPEHRAKCTSHLKERINSRAGP